MRIKVIHSVFVFLLLIYVSACTSNKNEVKAVPSQEGRAKDSVYDVFLVAGQSNTYYGIGLDTAIDKGYPGLYQLGRSEPYNMKVIPATEPLHHYFPKPDRIGFAMTFAKLYDEYTGFKKNILIVPCGMDWTGFIDSSWKRGDCLYNDAVFRTNEVMKRYPNSKLTAILWCQGERDVDNPKFESSLDTMIAGFRRDIIGANSKTPFIMGGMVPFWVEREEKRMKQQERLKNTPNRMPFVAYVDPYEPFRIEKRSNTVDEYHYNAEGQREMGKRFFDAYKILQPGK
ncbi:MAG: sialate O-acetylesterase [Bacteroidia bacterium]